MVNLASCREPSGFTLIELLVALAIVSLLLTLALPRYWSSVSFAREQVRRENLRVTRETIDKFYGATGRYPKSLQELVDRRFLRALPIDPVTGHNDTWVLVPPPEADADPTGAPLVFDLRSGAAGAARDGQSFGAL